ncbi:MAG: type II toxin-antitoxin system HicB family antitoxin [Candidatus Brockarchaeota archaeon]|nr:type II toxin-antitoxin system HicB family antitoxin [Candidatus Brockarchaeota archaeon]
MARELDENFFYVAQAPELPGCISQGKTSEGAIESIKDAIRGFLESLRKHGWRE